MEIMLPKNTLYDKEQNIFFEKVTALIGENGAGKSSILQSVFINCLTKNIYQKQRLFVFLLDKMRNTQRTSLIIFLMKGKQIEVLT
ncbi:TPA: hypothetical protein ACGQIY_002968 [Escherichia coli]|uniref:hypothetical protein n=1 Tax=Escherichia coli TaxID=562 RepID=UPI000A7B4DEB|nr:hypothetical protein [Escherichia coli]MEC9779422.1 hypothetical protein [Escherichia coli]MEC9808916.1 hypothetical protein [Escherichia coli]OYC27859.1 hypothetical protein RX23_04472 [Escherichia coli]WAH13715.1 hypothetical protein MW397_02985 [Escherichia coli]